MECPKCHRVFNLLAFKRLEIPEGYEDELTPVYRCPRDGKAVAPDEWVDRGGCGFIFAPAEYPSIPESTA